MKVLLVQPNNRSYVIMPSLGLGYLAAVLRNEGHDVVILNCLLERLNPHDFGKRIVHLAPDVIGFQVFSYDLNIIKDYLHAARAALPHSILIAGGPHPSGDPEGVLVYLKDLDYAFAGEAEIGFPLLLRRLEGDDLAPIEIPGLIYRDNGNILFTPPSVISDLNSLPAAGMGPFETGAISGSASRSIYSFFPYCPHHYLPRMPWQMHLLRRGIDKQQKVADALIRKRHGGTINSSSTGHSRVPCRG